MRLALVLLLAGCSATEVDVTVDASGLNDALEASARQLLVDVSDPDRYEKAIALPNGLRGMQGFVYRASVSSGQLDFTLQLRDANNNNLACGRGTATLSDGHATPITIRLEPGSDCTSPAADLGMPLDLSGTVDGALDGGAADLPPDYSTCKTDLGAFFCDDFEEGLKWSVQNADAQHTITIDAKAHRGSHSLLMHQDGYGTVDGSVPFYMVYAIEQISYSQPIWVRAFVQLDDFSLNNKSTTLVSLSGAAAAGVDVATRGSQACLTDYGTTMPPYQFPSSTCSQSGALQANKWICVEWYFDPNFGHAPDGGTSSVYVGGTQVVATQPVYEPFYPQVWLGWSDQGYSGDLPTNLWIDDLAISYQRIGCAQ